MVARLFVRRLAETTYKKKGTRNESFVPFACPPQPWRRRAFLRAFVALRDLRGSLLDIPGRTVTVIGSSVSNAYSISRSMSRSSSAGCGGGQDQRNEEDG